jgi:hypothetical protein
MPLGSVKRSSEWHSGAGPTSTSGAGPGRYRAGFLRADPLHRGENPARAGFGRERAGKGARQDERFASPEAQVALRGIERQPASRENHDFGMRQPADLGLAGEGHMPRREPRQILKREVAACAERIVHAERRGRGGRHGMISAAENEKGACQRRDPLKRENQ